MKLFFYTCTNQTLTDCPWFIHFSRIEGWRFLKKTFFSLCSTSSPWERMEWEWEGQGATKQPMRPQLSRGHVKSAHWGKRFSSLEPYLLIHGQMRKKGWRLTTRQHHIGILSPLMSACEVTCGLLWSQPHCRVLASGLRQRLTRWLITLKHVVSHFHCIQMCCFDPLSQLSCFCLKERHSVNKKI